jgi:hypothetical protein
MVNTSQKIIKHTMIASLEDGWTIISTSMMLPLMSCWWLVVADRVEGLTVSKGVADVFLLELGYQGDLFCEDLLSRHVQWKRGHGRCAAVLEIPCSGQVLILSLAGAA